jgi:DNA-binding NarL/FixJ family response regulator
MITICLVEDQTLVREGIQSLLHLTEDIRVLATASDGEEAIRVIKASRPDVVLLDVRIPKQNGLQVLRELQRLAEPPPTIILTTFDDDQVVLEGIKAGAKGYLLKDVSLHDLASAVRTVAAGGTLINPAITERVLRTLRGNSAAATDSDEVNEALTRREVEILRLLAAGYSNREIGEAFAVQEGTIKNHVSNILSKLGVRDRTRAVLRAIELGHI